LLFSASESHLQNHATTHDVFRHAPAGYLKVTLQHGFECVGFYHSADHVRAHGETASFGADIVCSWSAGDRLRSMAPSQRAKLIVTGPTAVLQMPSGTFVRQPGAAGIVCENLHSVRFRGAGDFRAEFVATFNEFARLRAKRRREIRLRAHPGGQYFLRNRVTVPANVQIENAPMYRLDLRQFSYGISAPSSVLIDMLLAKIPTAVWRDCRGQMDAGSYDGLTVVSSARDWESFARAAEKDPEPFLIDQKRFLEKAGMPLEPRDVFSRFAELFRAAERMEVHRPGSVAERERILFIANDKLPTYQLSFEKPLAALITRGEIGTALLTEREMRAEPGLLGDSEQEAAWLERRLNRFNPSTIIFCRYSGPAYKPILNWALRQSVPVIYHIDDDLLGVPPEIGRRKHVVHNAPERIKTVTELLTSADLVYASTAKLKARLLGYLPSLPIVAGDIYCSSSVLREPSRAPATKVGYMASADHAHNLAMVVEAVETLLERNPDVHFELFGSIPVPHQLLRFGERVSAAPAIGNYEDFLTEFAQRAWDVGICPLAPIDFNLTKADTKWVEYTSVGAAVIASRGTVYDECCAGGCGILAGSVNEWLSALDLLVNNVDERVRIVERAQTKLKQQYNTGRLRAQVLDVIARGHSAVRARIPEHHEKEETHVCRVV
jgi:glycosyltransferase involved in cell wall biosynthesis